jgi:hypothetical protein
LAITVKRFVYSFADLSIDTLDKNIAEMRSGVKPLAVSDGDNIH